MDKTNWDKYSKIMKLTFYDLYKEHFSASWKAYEDLLKPLYYDLIYVDEPIKILELGCGTGIHTKNMAKLFNVKKVVLVDNNKSMINIAKKHSKM